MEFLDTIDSKFRLVILAAKRAKQILNGSKKKVNIKADNPLTVAIKEIEEGKINFHILEENKEVEFDQDEFFNEDLNDDLLKGEEEFQEKE